MKGFPADVAHVILNEDTTGESFYHFLQLFKNIVCQKSRYLFSCNMPNLNVHKSFFYISSLKYIKIILNKPMLFMKAWV